VKYERRLVWYAPDMTDNATSIAFWRMSTVKIEQDDGEGGPSHIQVLPVLIVTSSAATKSVKTAST
jgi:hypothetical protein